MYSYSSVSLHLLYIILSDASASVRFNVSWMAWQDIQNWKNKRSIQNINAEFNFPSNNRGIKNILVILIEFIASIKTVT